MSDKEKKAYQSEALALPPLKMVLVRAENDRQNESAQTILESPDAIEKHRRQRAIAKLIEHLNEES